MLPIKNTPNAYIKHVISVEKPAFIYVFYLNTIDNGIFFNVNMELFVIIVNGFQPLTFITESCTLDVAAVLDQPLCKNKQRKCNNFRQAGINLLLMNAS